MTTWPNLFIVGAPRSGTTSLYEYLKNTNNIFMSPIKEPNFFSVSVNTSLFISKPIRDEKKYLELFNDATTESILGEATASYLWDPKAPSLIKNKVHTAKIIAILRDPVERSFSDYLYLRSLGTENSSFHSAITRSIDSKPDFLGRIIHAGMYSKQVERYLQNFSSGNVKILIFEEFIENTKTSVSEILKFLKIDSDLPKNINNKYNPQTKPKNELITKMLQNKTLRRLTNKTLSRSASIKLKKQMYKETQKPLFPEEERNFLEEIFKEDVLSLEKIIKRKVPWSLALKI